MGEAFIVRKGGVVSDTTAAPTITIVTEAPDGVTFTLTNNDDNTAFITYEIDDNIAVIELAAAATSGNITVALAEGTYTLTTYATVVGEVASTSDAAVEIVQIFEFDLLYDSNVSATLPLTQIDITGLSIGKNDELRLVYTFVGDTTAATAFYSIYPNDLTTETNYYTQNLEGNGTTLEAVRNNNSRFTAARESTNSRISGFIDIKVSNNDRFVGQGGYVRVTGSSTMIQLNTNTVGTQTVTSITKLSIISNRTDGIATDSRIRLYKVNTGDA